MVVIPFKKKVKQLARFLKVDQQNSNSYAIFFNNFKLLQILL